MNRKIDATIRAIAQDVYGTLGSGYSESVYDRAMQVGLRLENVEYENQKVVELKYKNHCVGEALPDLIVRSGPDVIVVELKAVSGELGTPEEKQLRNYLCLLNIKQGLLINFPQPGRNVRKKRVADVEFTEVQN
jgi:GxxExxY protein